MRVTRPVWRRFSATYEANAWAWVGRGGHAAIVRPKGRIELILTADRAGAITWQGEWAVLALSQRRARRITEGPAAGFFRLFAAPHAKDAVLDWCERDSGHRGPTRKLDLDCLDCGACCHESNVLLDEDDLSRFREGGRADLLGSKFISRSRDGKIRLRFAPSGRCQHLQRDNKCKIYELRPFNCSVFPVGSECCLAARESTLNLRDDIDATPL